jgi:CHAT domain-containing protein
MQFVAYSLVCMGMIYVEMGKTAEALTHYQQALAIQEEVGDRRGQAITLDKIGQTYGLTDQPVKSLENYQQALKRWEEINDRQGKALTLYGIARVERKQNKLRDSGKHVAEAIDIVESLRTKITSYQLRVNYFAARQDYYELDIDTRMRLAEATGSDAEMEAALGVAERARARSLIDLLVDSHAETKGTAPQYLIDKNQHLEEEISALSEKILRLRNESLRADSPGRKNQANETSAGGKSSDVKRLEDITLMEGHSQELIRDLDENEAKIRTSNPSYSTLKQPEPLAPRQIQQLLDDDTLLLEFALGEQRSYLWAVTPAKIVAFPLPGRSEIEIAVRRLREALTAYEPPSSNEEPGHYLARLRNASPQYRERASALSQLILEPVSSQIGTKRLVIVADGALQYVPFGALPVPSVKDGQKRLTFTPLLANNEIVYQPSATALALLRKKEPRPPAGSVAILADPVFDVSDRRVQVSSGASSSSPATTALSRALRDVGDSGTPEGEFKLQRLRYSGDEADAIFAIAAPGSSLKAVGFKANRATALSPELRRFRIVHFATHGILNAEHPELSGIVLSLVDEHGEAQNGFLQLRDIYDLNLPADLVVLSACRTALGKQVRGEGLIGLTRGFMYAGASRIVASLWKVDDEATAELMKRFYIHLLKEKMPASSALRQAQLDIMGRSQWRAPYYWAGFVLQGEWK